MKGARADPWAKMIRKLKSTRSRMMGASQKRLRVFKKSQNSLRMDNLDIGPLKLLPITFLPEHSFCSFYPIAFRGRAELAVQMVFAKQF